MLLVRCYIHAFPKIHLIGRIDIRELPLTKLLDPFLSLIRSPLSTGPITSVALNALASFFTSGLICPSSVDLVPALSDFSRTIAHCKFEASDSSGDEVVMLRILFVLRDCICGPVGRYLGDFEICEMLETVLTTCCQMRLSGTSIQRNLGIVLIMASMQKFFVALQLRVCMRWSEKYFLVLRIWIH